VVGGAYLIYKKIGEDLGNNPAVPNAVNLISDHNPDPGFFVRRAADALVNNWLKYNPEGIAEVDKIGKACAELTQALAEVSKAEVLVNATLEATGESLDV
jgi:hypothetical protein